MNLLTDEIGIAINDISDIPKSRLPENTVDLKWWYDNLSSRDTERKMRNSMETLKDSILDAKVPVVSKYNETPMEAFVEGYVGAHLCEKYNIRVYPTIQIFKANYLVKQDGPLKRKPNYHLIKWRKDGTCFSRGHIKTVSFDINALKKFKDDDYDILWILQSNDDYYFVGWYYYTYKYANFVVFDPTGTDENIELICKRVNQDQVSASR